MLEKAARFAYHGAEFEFDRHEMRSDPLADTGLQSAEQLVAPHVTVRFGQSFLQGFDRANVRLT
jgi:hypothetical protein